MKTYFRLLSFSKPYISFAPKYFVLAALAVTFGVLNFSLIIPLLNVLFGTFEIKPDLRAPEFFLNISYIKDLFNYYFNKTIITHGKAGALRYVCVVILVFVFLANVFRYWSQRVLTRMRVNLVKKIRKALFEKLSMIPLNYFNEQRKGNLLSIISNDVHEIENSIVSSVQVVFREPLLIIGLFILLFSLSVQLTIFTIIFLPLAGLIIATLSKKLRKQANQSQLLLGGILNITDEAISGTRIIKAFNAQKYVQKKFEEQNQFLRNITKSIVNKRELASPLSEFLGVLVVVCVLVYGGQLVLSNESDLTASEFITYIILYSQILSPAKNISTAVTNIQRGLAAGERVLDIIDTDAEKTDAPNAKPLTTFNNEISFRSVNFSYNENKPVLKNINLNIPKGKVIALVGQSGSGKSTLVDLLPRFYDVTSGEILIDGINIKDYKLLDLRNILGVVTQEAILFNDSVFNNIAFGLDNISKEKVIEAAKIANAHEFIMQMESGYHTFIGDRGGKLSGGQRQRLSIARAILKNPPILLLDEATSALDAESERLVQEALNKLMKNRTSIVIAHRLSTIQNADEIIVMMQGEIAEKGTHEKLLSVNGVYKKLYELQSFS